MAILLLGSAPAFAQAPTQASTRASPPDCRCRLPGGELRDIGTVTCLTVSTTPVMMRCEMSTNTPFWKPLGDGSGCNPA